MKFQDELESGKKSRKTGTTLQEALQEYRIKLANKVDPLAELLVSYFKKNMPKSFYLVVCEV